MAAQVSISELLARLNSLRADAGQPALKAWKESRAKLDAAIEASKAKAQVALDEKVASAEKPTKVKADPKAKPAPKVKAEKASGVFGLAELARELKINPKVARAKARRHKAELMKLQSKDGAQEGWVFPEKAREQVAKLMKGEKK